MSAGGYRDIVTDGLVFQVDAANNLSDNVTNVKNIANPTETGIFENGMGVTGSTYSFDGVDDYIDLGDILDFERTDIFTLECWIKSDIVKSEKQTIVSKILDSLPNTGWLLDIRNNGLIRFLLVNNASNFLGYDISGAITDVNKWYHIVVTYDGSSDANGVEIYLDSDLQPGSISSNTLTLSTLNNINFEIGSRDGSNSPFDGQLSSVKIYNKELTQSEITQNYEATKYRFI